MAAVQNELVSIVVCTYNGGDYIEQQLDSLILQSYRPIEILVLDDRSTDNTFGILQAYASKYDFIQCFQNEVNIGINENMALGFSKAKGKYICPCDQDDVWLPSKTQKLVDHIQDKKVDLVYCDSFFTDEQLNKTGLKESGQYRFIRGNDPRVLFFQNCISGHSVLFDRDLLRYCYPFASKPIYYDYWLALTALTRNGVDYIDKPLVLFRRHLNAQTNNAFFSDKEILDIKLGVFKVLLTHHGMTEQQKKYLIQVNQVHEFKKYQKFVWQHLLLFIKDHKILLSVRPKGFWSNMFYAFKSSFGVKDYLKIEQ